MDLLQAEKSAGPSTATEETETTSTGIRNNVLHAIGLITQGVAWHNWVHDAADISSNSNYGW